MKFENIIGYDNIKETLIRTLDIINNPKKYNALGATIPHGLLLSGSAGLGKTTLAIDFMKLSNRKSYIIKKETSDGDFINNINKTFENASKNTPSIILLDDLDKFTDNKDSIEEYAIVQSLIDKVRTLDIFIIATINTEKYIPESLFRAGRFDIKLRLKNPKNEESYNIIKYYLRNKKLAKDVNIKNISYILNGLSCADLEMVVNKAAIYAGFKDKDKITMSDLIKASLEKVYDSNIEDNTNKCLLNVSYHEAGHTLVGHLLEPNCITFTTVTNNDGNVRGLTIYRNNDNYFDDINFMINRIKILLAGKASTEVVYNKCDTGSYTDIERAYSIASRLVDDYCMINFNSFYHDNTSSEETKKTKDSTVSNLLNKYYIEVKELLIANRDKLDKLANSLSDKKILFKSDIDALLN